MCQQKRTDSLANDTLSGSTSSSQAWNAAASHASKIWLRELRVAAATVVVGRLRQAAHRTFGVGISFGSSSGSQRAGTVERQAANRLPVSSGIDCQNSRTSASLAIKLSPSAAAFLRDLSESWVANI